MISILTATYNRGNLLFNIYNSLLKQTEKNFEWVIVDDGSTDNTKELVQKMIEEKNINIVYKLKKNEGKHKALNLGVELCNGNLIVFLDSDDYFKENAIKFYSEKFKQIEKDIRIAGVSGLNMYLSNEIIGTTVKGEIEATSLEYRYKYKVLGDKHEAFKTEFLKEFKFPEFENEKFIPEALLFNRIANKGYKLLWSDVPVCICEYRADGLTAQREKIFVNSWNGYSLYLKEMILYKEVPISLKLKLIINYLLMGIRYKKDMFKVFNVKEKS